MELEPDQQQTFGGYAFGDSPLTGGGEYDDTMYGGNFRYEYATGAQLFVVLDALMILVLMYVVYLYAGGGGVTSMSGMLMGVCLTITVVYALSEWAGKEQALSFVNRYLPTAIAAPLTRA